MSDQEPDSGLVRVKRRRRRKRRSYSMPKSVDFRKAPGTRTGPVWWAIRSLAVLLGVLIMLLAMSALARRHGSPSGLPWTTAWMSHLGYHGWSIAVRSAVDDSMSADEIEVVLGPADERQVIEGGLDGTSSDAVRLVYVHGHPEPGVDDEDGAPSARSVSFVRPTPP